MLEFSALCKDKYEYEYWYYVLCVHYVQPP